MSETLLRCPFCGVSLKKIGSKRRGNQFYVHDYKGPDCILKEFSFKADDEEKMKQWNTRKPMQNIVERLEGEKLTSHSAKSEFITGMNMISANVCVGEINAYTKAIEIVKEEGGLNEN